MGGLSSRPTVFNGTLNYCHHWRCLPRTQLGLPAAGSRHAALQRCCIVLAAFDWQLRRHPGSAQQLDLTAVNEGMFGCPTLAMWLSEFSDDYPAVKSPRQPRAWRQGSAVVPLLPPIPLRCQLVIF